MKKRQFLESDLLKVPAEKRKAFQQLMERERYQHSSLFRFLFFSDLFYINLSVVLGVFHLSPELKEWFESFLNAYFLVYVVPCFLLTCVLGFFLRKSLYRLNQKGIHAIHAFFLIGTLFYGGIVISLVTRAS